MILAVLVGIMVLVLVVNYFIGGSTVYSSAFEKDENLTYAWKDMGDGLWKRTEVDCGEATDYLCVSNCYVEVPDCVKSYEEIVDFTVTSMGNEVFCISQSCSFEVCDIICPTG